MSQTSESYLNRIGGGVDKAWQEGRAPIVRFVTDDQKIVGVMFHHITRTYEDPVIQALLVSTSAGIFELRGPQVGLYHEKLAQGAADLVKANGKEIISVLYYPPPEDGEEGSDS
jgi:hypothetical protein